ncbi:MAG: TonB-dependent receptor [Candidatus Cryptobacteroides sp.]|nr:TonB-dependent receptor [Candidatus Cryptobacteroides sp.]
MNNSFFRSLVCAALALLVSVASYSQNRGSLVTVETSGDSLEAVFDKIEKTTRYRFIYNVNVIDVKQKAPALSAVKEEITPFLKKLFNGKGIDFDIKGSKVILSAAKAAASPSLYSVSGTVRDASGEPIPGAGVVISGTASGTVCDLDGKYEIKVPAGASLVFSSLGFLDYTVAIDKTANLDVTLHDDLQQLEQVVVVGYGTQKRSSLTGAISTVSSKDMLKAPVMSLSNVIGARVSGIAAVQSSGQPGANDASLTVRGQSSVIYVIDGIRRTAADFNGLDPNEIESVSVLKDASAVAVFGLDANAAFVVTTRKGADEDVKVSYSGSVGISQNAEKHDYLDGPEYAWWYNKALENVGKEPIFSAEQVEKMRAGVDGWGNTDWYDEMWGTGVNTHHNVSASGGNKKVHFFSSLGYMNEKGNLDNFDYKRYNLRTNLSASLSEGLSVSFGLSARQENRSTPFVNANPKGFLSVPTQICYALPFVPMTIKDSDGKEYPVATPTNVQPVSPYAMTQSSGYSRTSRTYEQVNASLQYDAPWLEGLSFKFQGAYDIVYSMNKSLKTPLEVMVVTFPTASTQELSYKKVNSTILGDTPVLSESAGRSSVLTSQTSVSYNNSFGLHNVSAIALCETRQARSNSLGATGYGLDFIQLDELSKITNLKDGKEAIPEISGSSSESRTAGFVGRVNWNYDERYYIEASLRHDGSYLFGGMNKRWVTLPGFSAAWRISNEEWFDINWIDNMKFRAGVGKTATSGIGAFQWMNTMALNTNAVVIGGASQSGISASILGNPNLTWSQCLSYNAGVDASLWGGKLNVEADVFYKYEFDKLSSVTGAYPPSMGGYYFSSANVNKVDYKGFDLTLNHRNRVGKLSYSVKFIWSYAYARWLHYAGDSKDTQEWSRLTGKQVGSQLALIAEGLYQSQDEIDNSAIDPTRPPLPGYIRYKDMDGDGIINYRKDQGYFSRSITPTHTGSLELSAAFKGFDFNMLFSWGLGNDVPISGLYVGFSGTSNYIQALTAYSKAFYQNGNTPRYLVENSWTPENPDAEFPCLEVVGRGTGNAYCSTFWNRNGAYLRLKTAQLGYTIPSKLLSRLPVESVRFYVEGFNLLTFSELTKFNIDPEAPGVNNGYYPQQRTASVGLKITFK